MSIYRIKCLANNLWLKACAAEGLDPASLETRVTGDGLYSRASRRANGLLRRAWGGVKLPQLPR